MSTLLQVIGREFRVRALMPAAGAVTAFGLLVTAWLSEGGRNFRDIAETSLPSAGFFLAGGGVLMGALMLARDLEGSRSLFWLGRPIGLWTTFAGKFLAALLLVVVTTFIVAIPALVVDPSHLSEPTLFVGALGFAVVCIAVGSTLGLLLRIRSAWFLAAAGVIIGFVSAAWAIARPFVLGARIDTTSLFISWIVGAFVVASIVAHAVAFFRGRHDARAQARVLTLVLAAILGGALALSGAFAGWLLGLDLEDFDAAFIRGEAGNAVVLDAWGDVPIGFGGQFAVDLDGGRSVRLEMGAAATAVSPRRIYYMNRISINPQQYELLAVDLGPKPRTRTTKVVVTGWIAGLATSRDGSRVAVVTGNGVQVYDAGGKSLGSFSLQGEDRGARVAFADSNRLRIYESYSEGLAIREADLRTRAIRQTGLLPEGQIAGIEGDHIVVLSTPVTRWEDLPPALHDARTGERIFVFPEGTERVAPLADGTWVVRGELGAHDVARVNAQGEIISAARLGTRIRAFGGEVRPGVLSVIDTKRSVSLVDVATWRVIRRYPELESPARWWHPFAEPGAASSRLLARGGRLFTIDPATLEAKKVELR
jgi:hypothetical protein